MARAEGNKTYRTFVKGLITEASALTYPEDSSYDELNTIITRKGNRSRRLGISYGAQAVDAANEVVNPSYAQSEYVWKSVANIHNTNFLATQNGNLISFYNLDGETSLQNKKTFTIDLALYLRPGATGEDSAKEQIQLSSGKGLLFIVGDKIEPLTVEYVKATDTILVTKIAILVRDFDGLNDGLQNDEEPSTLSKEHHYNLQNQGWLTGTRSTTTFSPVNFDGYVYEPGTFTTNPYDYLQVASFQNSTTDSPIFKYQSVLGRYPGNNKQWWVARAEADDPDKKLKAGDFLPDVLDRLYSGNNSAPKGHYILNAFKKDRSAVSGISDIPTEEIDARPNCVAFFSGRAWFGCNSTVYFSQILDSTGVNKAGLCYQEADPTAEDISDLLPTDGGVVPIPEIDRIIRLVPISNGMMVFAMNGVWFVSGDDNAFGATSLAVSKVSPVGTRYPFSIVETDGVLFWWSEVGIQALQQANGQFGPIPGKFGNTNVSEQTIQTFYNDIPDEAKQFVKTVYDARNNTIMWIYGHDDPAVVGTYQYNNVLLFDMTLQAFYPWKFSMFAGGPSVTGVFLDTGYASTSNEDLVLAGSEAVVNTGLMPIGVDSTSFLIRPSNVMFLTNRPGVGRTTAQTENEGTADWQEYDGVGLAYDSFMETGYEINQDTMRNKQAVYVVCHFTQGDDSSCTLQTKWEWSRTANSNKWSTPFEAYRVRKYLDEDEFEVITSKNKVRGSGKAIQFRFGTSTIGKNFDLLGWSVAFSGNTRV